MYARCSKKFIISGEIDTSTGVKTLYVSATFVIETNEFKDRPLSDNKAPQASLRSIMGQLNHIVQVVVLVLNKTTIFYKYR